MTREESQLWVADQFDDVVRASGVERGWMDIFEKDFEWRFDRDDDMLSMIGVWTPRRCGSEAGQIDEWLQNESAEDPIAAAARVRAHWEASGWTVTDVRADPLPENPMFRADRDDGALLGFSADAEHMSVEVVSPCSSHLTVSHPEYFRNQTAEPPSSDPTPSS